MRFNLLAATLLFSQFLFASDTIKPVSYSDTCALKLVPSVGYVLDLVTYKTQLGGYVCGNSTLNTPEKAQKYYWTDSSKYITAVALWFGQKKQSVSPGQIRANIYRVNPVTGAPSDLIAESLAKSVSQIDTSDQYTVLNLSTPTLLPDTFFVALDLTLLSPGDSIGLLSTRDGCFSGEQLAWEKDSSGVWLPFNDGTSITSWGLDIDMAIFPVGDFGLHMGIKNIGEMNAVIYPNPASEKIFIEINESYGARAVIRISDLTGKNMYRPSVIQQNERIQIDVRDFNRGIYLLEIRGERKTTIAKIVIAD